VRANFISNCIVTAKVVSRLLTQRFPFFFRADTFFLPMILCIGPTPAEQRVMIFGRLQIDEVNRASTTIESAAGKSVNVAKALAALGARPVATGFLGGTRGQRLRRVLEEKGVQCDFVEAAQTRLCITVIDETNGTQTELVEESHPVEIGYYEQLRSKIQNYINNCQAVIMSGTLTPGAPNDFYARCTELATASGAMSVVDTQGAPLMEALGARPNLVKPNRQELASALGRELSDEIAIIKGMRELHERGAQRVIVTAGKQAALAFDGLKCWRIFPPQVAPLNPIGSGDTFTAALVWSLLRGDEFRQAIRWAAAAGAANALTILAGEIEKGAVEKLFQAVRIEDIGTSH
jgi:1-phosphofructokinase family hexose kinase